MAVHIDKELCKSCKICIDKCPKGVFALTNHVNKKGYNYVEAAHPAACIQCGICQSMCPDFVIFIEK